MGRVSQRFRGGGRGQGGHGPKATAPRRRDACTPSRSPRVLATHAPLRLPAAPPPARHAPPTPRLPGSAAHRGILHNSPHSGCMDLGSRACVVCTARVHYTRTRQPTRQPALLHSSRLDLGCFTQPGIATAAALQPPNAPAASASRAAHPSRWAWRRAAAAVRAAAAATAPSRPGHRAPRGRGRAGARQLGPPRGAAGKWTHDGADQASSILLYCVTR